MKTEAVICIAFTRQIPSCTRLLRTKPSTVAVMLTNPRRPGISNHKYSVRLFILFLMASTFTTDKLQTTARQAQPQRKLAAPPQPGGTRAVKVLFYSEKR